MGRQRESKYIIDVMPKAHRVHVKRATGSKFPGFRKAEADRWHTGRVGAMWVRWRGPGQLWASLGIEVRQPASVCLCMKLRRGWVQRTAACVGPSHAVCSSWLPRDCSYQDLQKTIYSKVLETVALSMHTGWKKHTAEQ